ncbi:MAG: hypothetical protein ACM3XM_05320 [Mycobacterium leprae]
MLIGAIGGLVATVLLVLVWPRNRMKWARPLLPPVVGVLVAYLLMRFL